MSTTTCPRCREPVEESVTFCSDHSECVETKADRDHIQAEAQPVKWLADALTAEGVTFPHLTAINARLAAKFKEQPEVEEHA